MAHEKKKLNAVGSVQIQHFDKISPPNNVYIASAVGKFVVPTVDFIFTTIFLSIGVISHGEGSGCAQYEK